ncbi:hypothetical protein DPSP01_001663 [Paraphaeosphaeria sporulosa]|uniref:Uncharacterized protein n=1 Tax=Paraphaeosphaeria sporulosa TaxID=1460663 RepID=A0A177CRH5_9PLEO|nr:uncharacterized protein CC84DRAFT_1161126 [Paraphaeosphaeria sporulosa]OAG10125.1 hypothetical protein CC84DRAFT_1161126 [Paraphaeosphaeria sporulosa]
MPSNLTGGIVSTAVGSDDVPFDAHIELLCAHSPHFDEALDDRFEVVGALRLSLEEDGCLRVCP